MDQSDEYVPDGYVRIGHIARAHGIKGDVVAVFYSDEPERLGAGTQLLLDDRQVEIQRSRRGKDGVIVTLDSVADRNAAEALKGSRLFLAKSDRRSLSEGEYWPEDLIGLEAVDTDGNRLGTVADVVLDAAQQRLVISTIDERTVEVPFVDELVPEVSIPDGRVVVQPVEGLV